MNYTAQIWHELHDNHVELCLTIVVFLIVLYLWYFVYFSCIDTLIRLVFLSLCCRIMQTQFCIQDFLMSLLKSWNWMTLSLQRSRLLLCAPWPLSFTWIGCQASPGKSTFSVGGFCSLPLLIYPSSLPWVSWSRGNNWLIKNLLVIPKFLPLYELYVLLIFLVNAQ